MSSMLASSKINCPICQQELTTSHVLTICIQDHSDLLHSFSSFASSPVNPLGRVFYYNVSDSSNLEIFLEMLNDGEIIVVVSHDEASTK